MKIAAFILTAAILTGCATTKHVSPSFQYRAPGETASHHIQGTVMRESGMTHNHVLHVGYDGRVVASGSIGRGTGEISATMYDGRKIAALCNRSDLANGGYQILCRVMVNNEFAGSLTF